MLHASGGSGRGFLPPDFDHDYPVLLTGSDIGTTFACVAAAWQAHEGELRSYLRHRAGDVDTADDVLQDVFVKAMRQGPGFCSLDNPRAWLFQVARNALVDRARTAHPHEAFSDELAATTPLNEDALAPVDALADCLTRTLGELSEEDQLILRACDLEGQTQRSFALAQGLSLPATKSRLLRARQRLRDRLTRVCQISFEPNGSVCGHAGRKGEAARVERLQMKRGRDRVLHFLVCEGSPAERGLSINDLAKEIGLDPSTVSRFIAELRTSGDVVGKGPNIRLAPRQGWAKPAAG